MKRPRLPPDTRLDWRNPNMPVIHRYRLSNDIITSEVAPEYEQRYREHMMTNSFAPLWRNDPTYGRRKR